jgi:hypothetical protein
LYAPVESRVTEIVPPLELKLVDAAGEYVPDAVGWSASV